jgi:hypothetical protein
MDFCPKKFEVRKKNSPKKKSWNKFMIGNLQNFTTGNFTQKID